MTTLFHGLKNHKPSVSEENEDASNVSRTLNGAPPVRSRHP